MMDTKKLITLCKKYHYVYIYGAGKNAKQIYEFLSDRNIMPCGFLVSDQLDNPSELYNLPVITISKFFCKEKYLVLTSAQRGSGSEIYKDVFDCLVDNQVHNVFVLTDSIIDAIKKENRKKYKNHKLQEKFANSEYSIMDHVPVEYGHRVFAMVDKDENYYYWRFHENLFDKKEIKSIGEFFRKQTALEIFENQYGKYNIFKSLKRNQIPAEKSYKVYMTKCHVDKTAVIPKLPTWIEAIQVGAALTDTRICTLTDNTGENISEKNGIYSECTAIYWMWKNARKTDYIGLCHYRRHFDITEDDLSAMEVSNIDVLVTTPTCVFEGVEKFISSFIPKSDFMVFKSAIQNVCPEYIETAEEFLKSYFYPPCNLFIMKYELFQKYAEFVFSVTFEIESFYDKRNFIRQDRYMGYLVECLLGIFLMKHKDELKIAYTDMKFYE